MSNRRIKCKIWNVGSEKTRQVHGYEKQNRQEAGRVASAISMTRYDKHACCCSSIFFVRSHASLIKVTSSWQFPQAQWLSCKLWAPKSGWHFAYVTRYFWMFRCRFENFAHCSTIVYDSSPEAQMRDVARMRIDALLSKLPGARHIGILGFSHKDMEDWKSFQLPWCKIKRRTSRSRHYYYKRDFLFRCFRCF